MIVLPSAACLSNLWRISLCSGHLYRSDRCRIITSTQFCCDQYRFSCVYRISVRRIFGVYPGYLSDAGFSRGRLHIQGRSGPYISAISGFVHHRNTAARSQASGSGSYLRSFSSRHPASYVSNGAGETLYNRRNGAGTASAQGLNSAPNQLFAIFEKTLILSSWQRTLPLKCRKSIQRSHRSTE